MSNPGILAIQPRLPVADLSESHHFYRDVLGFEAGHADASSADGFLIVHRDGLGLQLVVARAGETVVPVTLWVRSTDALAEHARVQAHAPIEWGPEVYWYGSREFAVLDPDGHRIIFSTPTNEAPTCAPG